MRIAMVVAEPSGDNIAASLIRAMKAQQLDIQVSGICGPAMLQEGAIAHYSIDDISSLGIEGLLQRLRKILKIRRNYTAALLQDPPDVFVGIDAPDFNLSIQAQLRKSGIPTVQYVAPTVWAWRGYRIRKLKKAVEHLLTIYPFESPLFKQAGIPFTYVGHPIANQIASNKPPGRSAYGLAAQDKVIALLPGSRVNEVKRLTDCFLQTATRLAQLEPGLKFIAPFANTDTRELFEQILRSKYANLDIQLVMHDSLGVIDAADLVIAAAGTAALEVALSGRPVVLSYQVSQLTYWIVKMLSKTKYYSMLNHFPGGPVVPEFLQSQCSAENLTREALKLLRDADYRNEMLVQFAKIAQQLKCNTNRLAIQEIVRVAGR